MVRRVVAAVGRTLVAAGVILLLFVAYQLWGTGLAEARAQDELRNDFERLLTTTTTTSPPDDGAPTVTTTTEPPPPPVEGEAVAVLRIPRLGVDKAVVEGVGVADLKQGPGHYPGSPMPGQVGNAAIAGHRTTYGAPFYELDRLVAGDEVLVTTRQGDFRFEVDRTLIVPPNQVDVLDPTDEARLTLTTCNPRFSARERLVVSAVLTDDPAPTPPPPPGKPAEEPSAAPPVDYTTEAGLSGDDAARGPVLVWGVLAALVWFGTWLLSRRWRRWPAYALGIPVFLVVLFILFENVARLLPANI